MTFVMYFILPTSYAPFEIVQFLLHCFRLPDPDSNLAADNDVFFLISKDYIDQCMWNHCFSEEVAHQFYRAGSASLCIFSLTKKSIL